MAGVKPSQSSPVRWRRFLVKGTMWLSAEIVLGLIGLDTVADYSEFLTKTQMVERVSDAITTVTTLM
ncbi:MAG: hypothetical protein ACFBSG_00290 [Leptolyngbyaceae cyanobacterium]